MTHRFDLTVAAIAERDGRFLLVQERAARRIVLNQPAGHVEAGESLLDAVVREAREETGRAFVPQAVVGLYLWRAPTARTTLRVAFSGTVGERPDGTVLDRSIIRTLWLDRDEIAGRNGELRSPLVLRCVDDYLRGARYPLEMLRHLAGSELPAAAAGAGP